MAVREARLHIGHGRLDLGFLEAHDPLDDRCRSGVAHAGIFTARNEQAGDDSRRVRLEKYPRVFDHGAGHAVGAKARARCIVDRNARVDSAPSF